LGEVFYANHDSSSTQWTHPRTGRRKVVSDKLPFGWERQIGEDNKVIYIDHHNQRTTFTDPRLAFAVEKNPEKDKFRQRFDGSSRALQVLHGQDLTGRVAVVTGANSGIGFQTARALALHGCKVVFACRNEGKAVSAIQKITDERAGADCAFIHLDLASFASVAQFSKKLAIQHSALDYLVLNAGIFGLPYTLTEDGLESMMQVNYVSNFYLLKQLEKLLVSAPNPRIVLLSAESHRFAPVDETNLTEMMFTPRPSTFSSIQQYNTSKLFCALFAQAVHHKYKHLGIKCLAVHPGNLVNTNLSCNWWFYRILFNLVTPFTKSIQQAAGSVIFALCSPDIQDIEGFTYINNCFPTRPSSIVENGKVFQLLWNITNQFLESKQL
ncbi:WW domain-containing oxidoreductase, partial [Eurytemora carolleeae]|uniref:WW domain-containing oxidoreductase n=1 Tax=Eurytemora carolleeae TaxID=1294199 RepID=UPI000C7625FA